MVVTASLGVHSMKDGHSARSRGTDHATHNASTSKDDGGRARIYDIKLHTSPVSPIADRPTRLLLVVTELAAHDPIREFDLVHDRRGSVGLGGPGYIPCSSRQQLVTTNPSAVFLTMIELAVRFVTSRPPSLTVSFARTRTSAARPFRMAT